MAAPDPQRWHVTEQMKPNNDKWFRPIFLLNALPDAILAGTFLYAWLYPAALGLDRTRGLVLLMLLEFVNLHSSAFMGKSLLAKESRTARLRTVFGFGVFYSALVVAFAATFNMWWPVPAFWLLTANRLLILLPGQAPVGRERDLIQCSWAAGFVFYLAALNLSILPWPSLGFTPPIVKAMHLPGRGTWVDTPQRAMVAGLIYFGLTALSEGFGHRWFLKPRDMAAASGQGTDDRQLNATQSGEWTRDEGIC